MLLFTSTFAFKPSGEVGSYIFNTEDILFDAQQLDTMTTDAFQTTAVTTSGDNVGYIEDDLV